MPSLNPKPVDVGHINIVAVGDIMMGSTYPSRQLPPDDGRHIFDAVQEKLRSGDITFGNLEGPLTNHGEPDKCETGEGRCYEFMTPQRYIAHLKTAGFNAVSIANNHAFDCGPQGIQSTIRTLRAAGIAPAGGATVAVLHVKNRRIAFAGFSFSPSEHAYSIHDIPAAKRTIATLKENHDLVVVSFHGGAEGASSACTPGRSETFLGEERGDVMKFSRAVIDAGADLVLGHGPHVLRALELYKGRLIAYSLGNFLTYRMFNVKGPRGITGILSVKLDAKTGEFSGGGILPVKLTSTGLPEIDPQRLALPLIGNLSSRDIKGNCLVIDETTGILSPSR